MAEPGFLRATRASYDAVAADYAQHFHDELAARPLDRALLTAFAELVSGRGAVLDVGCGTGRITGFLADLGLDVTGIDLSPAMIAAARRAHPALTFEVGSMLDLDCPDGALGGLLAWYSTIHVPDDALPGVLAGFARALAPGGHLLLAFQAGPDTLHRSEALGHQIDLDFRRRQPDDVAGLLNRAGFAVLARVLREPDQDGPFPERTPQAYLLARSALGALRK